MSLIVSRILRVLLGMRGMGLILDLVRIRIRWMRMVVGAQILGGGAGARKGRTCHWRVWGGPGGLGWPGR